jgi:hypothetical protein
MGDRGHIARMGNEKWTQNSGASLEAREKAGGQQLAKRVERFASRDKGPVTVSCKHDKNGWYCLQESAAARFREECTSSIFRTEE